MSERKSQAFTSWKFDILDAMSCDAELQDIDFRVAFRLMQHINSKGLDAHPSLERLAAQIGVSRDTVMRSLNRLSDPKGACHWINRRRSGRTQPYLYSFAIDRLNSVIDGKLSREDRARETSDERKRKRIEVAPVQPREVANDERSKLQMMHISKLQRCNPNTLDRTTLEITPPNPGLEGDDLGSTPIPVPRSLKELEQVMTDLCEGAPLSDGIIAYFRKQLLAGTLTMEFVNDQRNFASRYVA